MLKSASSAQPGIFKAVYGIICKLKKNCYVLVPIFLQKYHFHQANTETTPPTSRMISGSNEPKFRP
jgi:hypothetical protein